MFFHIRYVARMSFVADGYQRRCLTTSRIRFAEVIRQVQLTFEQAGAGAVQHLRTAWESGGSLGSGRQLGGRHHPGTDPREPEAQTPRSFARRIDF
jgi:hypothetical protein